MRNCLLYTPPLLDAEAERKKQALNQGALKNNKKYRDVSHPKEIPLAKSMPSTATVHVPLVAGSVQKLLLLWSHMPLHLVPCMSCL